MPHTRFLASIAAATLGVALLGACSAESLTERAANFGLEQALEGEQDVDFDFSGDGGFSISTDEGDFSLNFDEDNGGIVFNTDEGAGAISFDEDGIRFNTDEGDGVISFDQDSGAITFDTDEGDGAINFSEDGALTVDTEDGSLGIFGSDTAPESWPAVFGTPASVVDGGQNFSVLQLGEQVVTTGVFTHAPGDPYRANLVEALLSNGWTATVTSDQDGAFYSQLVHGDGSTVQVIGDDTGNTSITLTVPQ